MSINLKMFILLDIELISTHFARFFIHKTGLNMPERLAPLWLDLHKISRENVGA